jgi:hypothetical protein
VGSSPVPEFHAEDCPIYFFATDWAPTDRNARLTMVRCKGACLTDATPKDENRG